MAELITPGISTLTKFRAEQWLQKVYLWLTRVSGVAWLGSRNCSVSPYAKERRGFESRAPSCQGVPPTPRLRSIWAAANFQHKQAVRLKCRVRRKARRPTICPRTTTIAALRGISSMSKCRPFFKDARPFPLSNLPLDSRLHFCGTRLVEQVAKRQDSISPEPQRFPSKGSLHVED